jgi:hypothetical protein
VATLLQSLEKRAAEIQRSSALMTCLSQLRSASANHLLRLPDHEMNAFVLKSYPSSSDYSAKSAFRVRTIR